MRKCSLRALATFGLLFVLMAVTPVRTIYALPSEANPCSGGCDERFDNASKCKKISVWGVLRD